MNWILHVRLKHRSFWDAKNTFNARWNWNYLLELREGLRSNMKSIVGDGLTIYAWNHNWSTLGPFCNFIPKREIYEA